MCNAVNELFADQIKEMELIIADKDAIIAELRAKVDEYTKKLHMED